jgi:hypothetical protein
VTADPILPLSGGPLGQDPLLQVRQAAADRTRAAGKTDAGAPPDAHGPAAAGSPEIPASIRSAAVEFEAVFASEMLSHMFKGVGSDPLFGGGNGEEVFRSMMVDQYGRAIARTGTLGIADQVAAALLKAQEK